MIDDLFYVCFDWMKSRFAGLGQACARRHRKHRMAKGGGGGGGITLDEKVKVCVCVTLIHNELCPHKDR